MSKREPTGPPPPLAVQKLRLRYTKRGRLRFTSHRDIARAFERALRRAKVPMAYSAGFSPHPKISWVGAAPTGVASEAEYVEISVVERVDLELLRRALDESLPSGIDIVEVVEAPIGTSLPDRVEASRWGIRLPQVPLEALQSAVVAFLAADAVPVERLMKAGLLVARRRRTALAGISVASVVGVALVGSSSTVSPVRPPRDASRRPGGVEPVPVGVTGAGMRSGVRPVRKTVRRRRPARDR